MPQHSFSDPASTSLHAPFSSCSSTLFRSGNRWWNNWIQAKCVSLHHRPISRSLLRLALHQHLTLVSRHQAFAEYSPPVCHLSILRPASRSAPASVTTMLQGKALIRSS
ncbi:hypothetical protein BLNAU_3555 [Blattamonas nauphoetae]|uniref:Uncharacterized protein n=1 Tax=Blattamonas nauphoetae TaxID=2049346 RepID=A0ABQ9YCH8_9EUKA|nr:hypothetical protein BLNAU_3555 [Blattamonas nauphoetae]